MYKVKATANLNIVVKDLGIVITDDSFVYIKKRDFENSADINGLLNANPPLIVATKIIDASHPDPDINNNLAAIIAPAVTDDITKGYSIGSLWIDTVADKIYICVNNATGAAIWKQVTTA